MCESSQFVESVPAGRVATYGQVADEAGLPRRARLVGRVLSELPQNTRLPWHRIVNARGAISVRSASGECSSTQKRRLLKEGIVFRESGLIDLARFGWEPAW